MTDSVWRFLFSKVGRDLGASFPLRALESYASGEVAIAKAKGAFRELPLVVHCHEPGCLDSCEMITTSVEGDRVRLACPFGNVGDRVVPRMSVAAVEIGVEGLLRQFALSSEIEFRFDPGRRAGRLVPFGRIPWLDNRTICLAIALRRSDVTADLAAATALGDRSYLVLLPPDAPTVNMNEERLEALGIRAVEMDRVMDWANLELKRVPLIARLAASEVREDQAPYGEGLVLYPDRCEVKFQGHEVILRRLAFGFLLALARKPGTFVSQRELATNAYEYQEGTREIGGQTIGGVGQIPKLKNEILSAFRDLSPDLVPDEVISAKRGIGYRLELLNVRIESQKV